MQYFAGSVCEKTNKEEMFLGKFPGFTYSNHAYKAGYGFPNPCDHRSREPSSNATGGRTFHIPIVLEIQTNPL